MVNFTSQPLNLHERTSVPIQQETGWASEPFLADLEKKILLLLQELYKNTFIHFFFENSDDLLVTSTSHNILHVHVNLKSKENLTEHTTVLSKGI